MALRLKRHLHKLSTRRIPDVQRDRASLDADGYTSQYGQDRFAVRHFEGKRGGTFLDIGANDGVTSSNSHYLEKELGWSGVAVEPIPEMFARLSASRTCHCENVCIGDYNGTAEFLSVKGPANQLSGIAEKYSDRHRGRVERAVATDGGSTEMIQVVVQTLEKVLAKHGIDRIDFMSLDTEGGELETLKSIDFDRVYVGLISVENNGKDSAFRRFLEPRGYRFVARAACDEIYAKA